MNEIKTDRYRMENQFHLVSAARKGECVFMKKRVLFLVLVLSLAMFSGCGSTKSDDETISDTKKAAVNTETDETEEEQSTGNEDVQIGTPYGNLSYPYGFEEIVKSVEVEKDDVQSYEFYAVVNEQEIKVYTISFSVSAQENSGDLLGTVQDNKGETVNVYCCPEENIIADGTSEDDQNTIYTAQETVNDVIASLKNFSGFQSVSD